MRICEVERGKSSAKNNENNENISGLSNKRDIFILFYCSLIISLNIICLFNIALLNYSIYYIICNFHIFLYVDHYKKIRVLE